MPDNLDEEQRRRCMSAVKGADTKLETTFRRAVRDSEGTFMESGPNFPESRTFCSRVIGWRSSSTAVSGTDAWFIANFRQRTPIFGEPRLTAT